MEIIILFVSLLAMLGSSLGQRGDYAGKGPIGSPNLSGRFRDDDSSAVASPNVGSRLSDNQPTPRIPIDARGDADLISRLNQWPRQNRPFWVLNAEHIEAQRNTPKQQQFAPNEIVDRYILPPERWQSITSANFRPVNYQDY